MTFAISVLASLVVGLALPSIVRFLNNVRNHLFVDVPKIEGDWKATFTEADGTSQTIEVHLSRFGKSVRGRGHVTGRSEDPFDFRAELSRQSLVGGFRRSRSQVLAGTGAFLLKISADERKMSGSCSWYDTGSDNVWNSKYEWEQK